MPSGAQRGVRSSPLKVVSLLKLPFWLSHISLVIGERWCLRKGSSYPFLSWYNISPFWLILKSSIVTTEKSLGRSPFRFTSYTCGKLLLAKKMDFAVGMMAALNRMCSLSRHAMGVSLVLRVVNRLGSPPNLFITKISKLPSRLDAKAIFLPSGLQMG